MSNDMKFWTLRVINAGLLLFEMGLLMRAAMSVGGAGENGHAMVWFTLFFIACLVNMPMYIALRRAKDKRWGDSSMRSQQQIDVETLAAYGAQQQREKEQAAARVQKR